MLNIKLRFIYCEPIFRLKTLQMSKILQTMLLVVSQCMFRSNDFLQEMSNILDKIDNLA